jgi:hypothetical protein
VTRILSGIQPTGEIHLGNYLGALRHWEARQADAECLFLIADLHAITTPQDPGELRKRTWGTATLLLSLGIDPKRSILFLQSQVGYHAELAWVLNCLTRVGELRRMVQFKEKESRRDETGATAGLFTYPVLQAADILLYQADGVPVGEDQKQHLELARDLAQRFNNRFSATFRIPEPLIAPMGARIMDLQNPQKEVQIFGVPLGDHLPYRSSRRNPSQDSIGRDGFRLRNQNIDRQASNQQSSGNLLHCRRGRHSGDRRNVCRQDICAVQEGVSRQSGGVFASSSGAIRANC